MHSSMKCVVQHPSTYIVTVKMEELTREFLLTTDLSQVTDTLYNVISSTLQRKHRH
jgi:hypothetical protein